MDRNPYLTQLYRRAFGSQDPALLQVTFDAAVIDRYRSAPGFELIRTDSAGRISKQGGWSIDVGIAGDTVHASVRDVMDALPEAERDHWAQHAVALPMSQRFLQMRLAPASCFDDGEVRAWS